MKFHAFFFFAMAAALGGFPAHAATGPDPVEMVIELSDSTVMQEKILVVKRDDSRAFYRCATVDGAIDRSRCSLVGEFSVKRVELDREKFHDGNPWFSKQTGWRWATTTAGAVIGVFTGALLQAVEDGDGGPAKRGLEHVTKNKTLIVTVVLTTGIAYFIGNWLDGPRFSILETASIRGTIALTEVLDEKRSAPLSISVPVRDFVDMLTISAKALDQ